MKRELANISLRIPQHGRASQSYIYALSIRFMIRFEFNPRKKKKGWQAFDGFNEKRARKLLSQITLLYALNWKRDIGLLVKPLLRKNLYTDEPHRNISQLASSDLESIEAQEVQYNIQERKKTKFTQSSEQAWNRLFSFSRSMEGQTVIMAIIRRPLQIFWWLLTHHQLCT